MKKLEKGLIWILDLIGMVFLSAAILLVAGNVIWRLLVQSPIPGSYELTGYFTSLFVSVCLPMCMVLDSHIKVDIITSRLKRIPQEACDYFARLIDLIVSLAFTVGGWTQFKAFLVSKAVTNVLGIPIWPFKLVWTICCAIMVLAVVMKICMVHSAHQKMQEAKAAVAGAMSTEAASHEEVTK